MSDRAPTPWIALVGMMGAGKSTVGQALARRLGVSFVDLDVCIEQRTGVRIPEIFAQQGANSFRALECQALIEILTRTPTGVLATGGGVMTHEQSAQVLMQGAYTVYLEVGVPELVQRLSSPSARKSRPLLPQRQGALGERLVALLGERRSRYQASHLVVNAATSVADVVERIALNLPEGWANGEDS